MTGPRTILTGGAGVGSREVADRPRLLLVEDNEYVADALIEVLGREGYEVSLARNGNEALALLRIEAFALVVTDIVMPDMDGIELIQHLRARHPGLGVVAISGDSDVDPSVYLRIARHLGVKETVAKPFSSAELLAAVNKTLLATER